MLKRLAILALVSVSLASAKSYTITLSDPCLAGTTQLKPGKYTLKLDGSKVSLIDHRGNTIEAPLKVETVDRKFGQTAIEISKVDGSNRLQAITLAGSKAKVVFEQ
jgi:hypothetical protein